MVVGVDVGVLYAAKGRHLRRRAAHVEVHLSRRIRQRLLEVAGALADLLKLGALAARERRVDLVKQRRRLLIKVK